MTRTRWLIALFWVFVAVMLFRQCRSSDIQRQQEEIAHPTPGHFFFVTPPPAATMPVILPPAEGPDVRQTHFEVHASTPGMGSFTCDVTVTNEGQKTAHNVQVHVRPYRGVKSGSDVLGGHTKYQTLPENDPLSQYGTWITFPDLKPQESGTQSAVFLDHPNVHPGYNPQPEIIFESPK